MGNRRRRAEARADLFGCLLALAILASPFLVWAYHLYQERGWEQRLRQGTEAAYAGTARKDVELARRALAAGDVALGEERASRAKDKLGSPMLTERPQAAVGEAEALEREHEKSFKPIRRKRAHARFGSAGAEVK